MDGLQLVFRYSHKPVNEAIVIKWGKDITIPIRKFAWGRVITPTDVVVVPRGKICGCEMKGEEVTVVDGDASGRSRPYKSEFACRWITDGDIGNPGIPVGNP